MKQDRRCVACREQKNQREMIRFAKINDEVVIDKNQKLQGRGAYVCKSEKCIGLTIKKRLLNRAFKMSLDNTIYVQLGEYEQNN